MFDGVRKKNKCKDIFRAFAIACGTVFYFIKMKKQNKTKQKQHNKIKDEFESKHVNMIQSVGSSEHLYFKNWSKL